MTVDKRTRAELQSELRLAKADSDVRAQLVAEKYEAELKTLKARLDRQTPEARAIDMCVDALDALRQAERDRSPGSARNYSPTYSNVQSYGYVEVQPLDSVGQVLAYLRLKYGLLDPSGEVEHLRNRVNRLTAENGALREQLQRVGQMVSEAKA